MLALSQTQGYVLVGIIASIIPLGSAYLAFRANREATKATSQQGTIDSAISVQGGLIEGLVEDNKGLRAELRTLRVEFEAERVKHDECEDDRAILRRRVAELERAS